MKIKLSITDEFLWKIYNAMDAGIDALNKAPPYSKTIGLRMIGSLFGNSKERRRQYAQLVYRLKVRGYITVKNLEGVKTAFLTKNGFDRALRISFASTEKVKRKDGKWIMLIFDIPKTDTKARELMRSILKNLGYKIFQHSVWVSPYDVSTKTEKALQYYSLEKYVKIFLIEKI